MIDNRLCPRPTHLLFDIHIPAPSGPLCSCISLILIKYSDVILKSDDGSGGTTAYLTLDGSATTVNVDKNMIFADTNFLAKGLNFILVSNLS